jgi:Fur family peroxide stress response transcriptional regulator
METLEISSLLKEHGLKVTNPRMKILEILMNTKSHPSADDIINTLTENGEKISVATVYNVLETFVDKGIIQKFYTSNEVMRFDYCTDLHIHLHDENSNLVTDFEDDQLVSLICEYIYKEKKYADRPITNIDISFA